MEVVLRSRSRVASTGAGDHDLGVGLFGCDGGAGVPCVVSLLQEPTACRGGPLSLGRGLSNESFGHKLRNIIYIGISSAEI